LDLPFARRSVSQGTPRNAGYSGRRNRRFRRPAARPTGDTNVVVESVHTGKLCAPETACRPGTERTGNTGLCRHGRIRAIKVRWVLVDTKVEDAWPRLPRRKQRELSAVVSTTAGPNFCTRDHQRLSEIGVADGTVFHLYAIERSTGSLACAIPEAQSDVSANHGTGSAPHWDRRRQRRAS